MALDRHVGLYTKDADFLGNLQLLLCDYEKRAFLLQTCGRRTIAFRRKDVVVL